MGAENKYITNKASILSTVDNLRNIQIGVVASVDDPQSLGRIKVSIAGSAEKGGDLGTSVENLPWCYPMIPKFFTSTPKVGEGVFVFIFDKQKTHSDRLYLGPIISQLDNLNNNPISSTALSPFTFSTLSSKVDVNRIPALRGVFHEPDDVAIQGRFNTDILLKKNQIVLRAGKFIEAAPNENNPYPFEFNRTSQAYIQLNNDVPLNVPQEGGTATKGSVTNIVANKINLLTHKDGAPRFNLTNQEDLISESELLKILETAHPLPFGDILVQYLTLLKNAFLNHVHNNNGKSPTDLVIGGAKQDVKEFKKNAEDLENRMLSKNIRIN